MASSFSFSFSLLPPSITPSSSSSLWRRQLICPPWLVGSNYSWCISAISKERSSSYVRVDDNAGVPWLMLPPSFEGGGHPVGNFYNLATEKVVKCKGSHLFKRDDIEVVGSSYGFLALFNKRNHELHLYNPISGRLIELPSIHTLSLSDIGLGPLHMRVTKLIISHDRSRALMIFGPANRLAFCCPERSHEWTPLGTLFIQGESARVYRDMVYSERHKVFMTCCTNHDDMMHSVLHRLFKTCCTPNYEMEEWDLRLSGPGKQTNLPYKLLDFEQRRPSWWHDKIYCYKEYYVVEHSDNVYVVHRYIMGRREYLENKKMNKSFPVRDWDDEYPYKTIAFDVYKASPEGVNGLRFKYMQELDNLVFFLGRNHSFALTASSYSQVLHPGSIYFTDNPRHTPLHWQTYGNAAHDTAVYYFNDSTFHPIFHDHHLSTIQGIVPPPLWFTPH